jgi:sulfatase modifying factor 1
MKENEDFIQKKQTKSRKREVWQKAKVKAVEQKARSKNPASSKGSKAAPISNTSNKAYSYFYLTEALVSLFFTLSFLFVFGTSLSWVERYAILWNFDQLDWKMLVPVGLAVVSLVLGGNSLRTFFLAYKQGEVRGALLLLWKLRTWLVSVCVGLMLVIFVLAPLIDSQTEVIDDAIAENLDTIDEEVLEPEDLPTSEKPSDLEVDTTAEVENDQNTTFIGNDTQPNPTGSNPTAEEVSSDVSSNETITLEYPKYDLSLVFVEGGSFAMGSNFGRSHEAPVHVVTLDDFHISRYEITNKQYCVFLNERGNKIEGGVEWIDLEGSWDDEKCRISEEESGQFIVDSTYEDHAVIFVSWYGARAFCTWLSSKIGKEVRLPTEAEWEYAARGGKESRDYAYSGSNILGKVAWFLDNSNSRVHKVGGKSPNELGLYDMTGNVLEWCLDWYNENYYSSSLARNPKGADNGYFRVLRGGSWSYYKSDCRIADRNRNSPSYRNVNNGFRVAAGGGDF